MRPVFRRSRKSRNDLKTEEPRRCQVFVTDMSEHAGLQKQLCRPRLPVLGLSGSGQWKTAS